MRIRIILRDREIIRMKSVHSRFREHMARKIRKHALPGDIACCHGPGIKALNCCVCTRSSLMPHTSQSRSISLRASPNSHFRASSLSCVTYTLTDSPCCLTLLWNLYRWTITGGLGLKCSAINFISSSYVLPPGVSGATRLASVWYAFGPIWWKEELSASYLHHSLH